MSCSKKIMFFDFSWKIFFPPGNGGGGGGVCVWGGGSGGRGGVWRSFCPPCLYGPAYCY